MSAPEPLAADEDSREIAALIDVLHKTDRRLENLTGGEVDTVADRTGEPFMLRRSQEELRVRGAATQSAILNALPAHVALLDAEGIIISANDAWRQFDGELMGQCPGHATGVNYIEVCQRTCGEGSAEAHRAAAGIRSVLNGSAATFSMAYPCHTAYKQRWLLLSATPLSSDHPEGAVVMHMDVTAERQTNASLLASEVRFRQLAENIRDVFFLRDVHSNRILYVSPAYEEIWGRSCESLYEHPESWIEAIHPDDRNLHDVHHASCAKFELHYRVVRPDGSLRWIEFRGFPVSDSRGEVVRIAGVAQDITARKETEVRIAYLNRVAAVLTSINILIVRVRDRDELFREACRIVVEDGGFVMSWIGIVDPASMKVVPVASRGGDDELISAIARRLALGTSGSIGDSLAAQAITQKKAVVSNDAKANPHLVLGPEYAEAGMLSIAILPLIVSDEAVGALALYAREVEFFHDDEMKLLGELAGDIAFAIDHLQKRARLDYLAYYDVLTGLANRRLFLERVATYIHSAASGGHKLALFVIDIERFKNINDSLGSHAGDALLNQVAEWLTRHAGDANLVARLDADHFAVVLPQVKEDGSLARLIEKLITSFIEHPFRLNDAVFRVGAKVGVSIYPDDGVDANSLFRNTEAALKKAKASGDHYLFYTQTMTATVHAKLTLENQLRQALDNEEFVLHYQPKVNIASGRVTGAEALIRWNDPRTGLVAPGRFIPVLEETGLIYEVGRWALQTAVADYLRWRAAGLPAVRIAVNVSPLQLRNRGFTAEVERAIGGNRDAAAGLELEITESLIMEDVKHTISSLEAVRGMGVRLAIDDFGTGFSSLSYLSRLPVDTLKIDRGFVIGMTEGPQGLALVSTIIRLAHAFDLEVVAEGVETEEQSRLLRLLSCNEMQGFLFSKPLPRDIFEKRHLADAVPSPGLHRA